MKKVYVVIDSQGTLLGVFKKQKDAQAVADNWSYFCTIVEQDLK